MIKAVQGSEVQGSEVQGSKVLNLERGALNREPKTGHLGYI